jgi:hypothetical protein
MAIVGGWALSYFNGGQDALLAMVMYTAVGVLGGATRLVARPLPWALAGLLVVAYVGYFVVWNGIEAAHCPDCAVGDLTRFDRWWIFMIWAGALTAWLLASIALGASVAETLRVRTLLGGNTRT